MNMLVGPGYVLKLVQNTSNEWDWSISRFRKVLAEGHAATEKLGRAALEKAAGVTVVDTAVKSSERSALKTKLRDWTKRRPYIVMHALRGALDGLTPEQVVEDAAREEAALREFHVRQGVVGIPPPPHKLSKPAAEVAQIVCDLIVKLEWKKTQVQHFGAEMLGVTFASPNAVDPVQVVRKAARAEVLRG